ncbi:MAG: serine protease, partial [Patescibacteria group bacterium]|nr:serine protease [Patescibacteria group bacterium]
MRIATLPYRRLAPCVARLPLALAALLCAMALSGPPPRAADSLPNVIEQTQPKMVKLYGAGGFKGLHSYQTGMLISPDGHVLTIFSYVLDTDYVTAVTHDGRRFEAKLVGADPRLEIAVLKIDGEELSHFNLDEAAEAEPGARVLGLSNLFGVAMGNEPASVQRGVIAARTNLQARRGQFETAYRGPVYILDVTTNNPGAAGGALVTLQGRLLGMLGKELRNAQNHTWLNYALPVAEIKASVAQILSGVMTPPEANPDATKPEL